MKSEYIKKFAWPKRNRQFNDPLFVRPIEKPKDKPEDSKRDSDLPKPTVSKEPSDTDTNSTPPPNPPPAILMPPKGGS